MEQKVDTRKKVMKVILWVVVIVALLLTAHIVVNNFHALEFIRKLHGG